MDDLKDKIYALDYSQFMGYQGNPRLRRAHAIIPLTEWQENEMAKCMDDPVYFGIHYMKIVHVDKGLIPFEMWDFQKKLVKQFYDNRFNIGLLPRQVGKSICSVVILLHHILFDKFKRAAILANKGNTAREIMGRLQLAYENLPPWMQQGVITWNKGDILLENGSLILTGSTTSSAIRGFTFSMVFLDEFAFVPTNIADEFFTSTYPTISSGKETKIIIISTPKGMNHFYKRWKDATEGNSDFVPFTVNWWDVPGRDEAWKKQTIRNTSEEQFAQEHCNEFLGSSNTLISGSKLKQLAWTKPIFVSEDKSFLVHELPKKEHVYAITVDVSRGQGLDYSAFSVFDITSIPYKQVAIYRNNKIDPILFPTIILTHLRKYNDAFVLVELNDIGQQIAETLHYEFGYENIIKVEMKTKLGQLVSGVGGKKMQLGIKQSTSTKKIGCANLKALIENDKLIITDADTIMELTTFVAEKNTYMAEVGAHDDIAMTLVIFGWLVNQRFFKESHGSDIRKVLQLENLKLMDTEFLPFLFDDGGNTPESFRDMEGNHWKSDGPGKNDPPWYEDKPYYHSEKW